MKSMRSNKFKPQEVLKGNDPVDPRHDIRELKSTHTVTPEEPADRSRAAYLRRKYRNTGINPEEIINDDSS